MLRLMLKTIVTKAAKQTPKTASDATRSVAVTQDSGSFVPIGIDARIAKLITDAHRDSVA